MKNFLLFATLVLWAMFNNFLNAQTTTFEFTGEVQTYVVPSCVTTIDVVVAGAQGGGVNSGNGAIVSATLDVAPGQILEIYVGGQGGCPAAGFNGGGLGTNALGINNDGCGGGGASDIRMAPYDLVDRLIIAAGGGGMGGGNTNAQGGVGGCASGSNGNSPFGEGGQGGTQVSGGAGGPPWIASGTPGEPGSLGQGGNGATDPCFDLGPGGGGGGGYYGGGGGGSDCFGSGSLGGGGGGGGSSFTPDGGNCVPNTNTGQGFVTITTGIGGMVVTVEPAEPTICEGESVEIIVSGGVNYSWAPDIGLDVTTGPVVIASPASTQTYEVYVNDGEDCYDTLNVTVDVTPIPVVNISPSDAVICTGESVTLNASGADEFEWTPETGLNTNTGSEVIASPESSQIYTVTGTVSGCTGNTSVSVVVNELPEISTVPTFATICPGDSIVLTGFGGENYTWSPAEGLVSTIRESTVASPDVTTTYTVTGLSPDGCENTAEVVVEVSPLPEVSAGPDQVVCIGDYITLFGTGPIGASYSWQPADGLDNPNAANVIVSPSQSNTFTLTVTDENGCVNSDDVTISVISVIADFIADPTTGNAPIEIIFENNSTNAGFYEWDYGDGNTESTTQILTQNNYAENGTFTVTLIAIGQNFCRDTITMNIILEEPFALLIPNVFTPNGDGINDFFELDVRGVSSIEVEVYDRWGIRKHIHNSVNGRWDGTHNGVNCSDGVYFYIVNLTTNDGDQQTHKGSVTLLRNR